jgi:hypothetical protein
MAQNVNVAEADVEQVNLYLCIEAAYWQLLVMSEKQLSSSFAQ